MGEKTRNIALLLLIAVFNTPGVSAGATGETYPSRTVTFDGYRNGHTYSRRDAGNDFGNANGWYYNRGPHIVDNGVLIVRTR